jgi:hypothetical protein
MSKEENVAKDQNHMRNKVPRCSNKSKHHMNHSHSCDTDKVRHPMASSWTLYILLTIEEENHHWPCPNVLEGFTTKIFIIHMQISKQSASKHHQH